MNVTSAHSEKIEAALKTFIANPEPYLIGLESPLDLRELAAELNALPMFLDFGGCYAIRPNGEIISFDWDEPYNLESENDPRIRNLVLFQGAKKYPKLSELVPSRLPDAEDCPHCNGTGMEPMNKKLGFDEERIVCYCGGLGWLPK
ncbi:MAG: hypothetical protein H0T45_12985 [Pyrinomonadaceae bacterium]|nr:hypothetical protein [Pyrinomonadaceae bacterium]